MNIHVQNQKEAVILRRQGFSYTDISKRLKVSRASVCNWVKNIKLTEQERSLLQKNNKNKSERGRMRARITIQGRRVFKEKNIYETAEKEFPKMAKDPFFMFGLGLWGFERHQKNRTSFTFTTPTHENMTVMLQWLKNYLQISEKTLKIRVIKHSKASNASESRSITITKILAVRRLLAWQKLTMLYYS
jgi:hypothetical protein